MTFTEKLRRCSANINKSKAGAAVGLKANIISTYIAKKSIPRADIALQIARALKVSADWLLDDSLGWPPPETDLQQQIINIPDAELMREACRRLDNVATSVHEALRAAESADWSAIAVEALSVPLDQPLPKRIAHFVRLTDFLLASLETLWGYDASHVMEIDPNGKWNIENLYTEVGSFLSRGEEAPDAQAFQFYARFRKLTDEEKREGSLWENVERDRQEMLKKAIKRRDAKARKTVKH